MNQRTLLGTALISYAKMTRQAVFLAEMNQAEITKESLDSHKSLSVLAYWA